MKLTFAQVLETPQIIKAALMNAPEDEDENQCVSVMWTIAEAVFRQATCFNYNWMYYSNRLNNHIRIATHYSAEGDG